MRIGRKINNRINIRRGPHPTDTMWVVCECASDQCEQLIQVTVDDYRQIREGDSYFLMIDGHESPGFERVIAREGIWLTVQRIGEPKRYVEEMDTS